MKITKLKSNPKNPRLIKDDKFFLLVNSLREFPKMMELRPIVVDDNYTIVGGNMRYKALRELGYKDIPDNWVKEAKDFTEDELAEFVIKDNVGYGEWDTDILANEWDTEKLASWGYDIPALQKSALNLDEFFEDSGDADTANKFKIVLEYTEDDYNQVVDALQRIGGSKEKAIYNLLIR